MNKRTKENYMFVREKPGNEVEWLRPADVPKDLQRPIVLVTGVFDILHIGHLRMLFAAREKAGKGTLVVAVNSDQWVKTHKGSQRPIMNFVERVTSLGYMPIDVLTEINTEVELRDLTTRLRPDLKVMGSDHIDVASKYPWMRKMFVRSGGMSTSEIIRRILERYGKAE